MKPLINWVTFFNAFGSNLFTYGEIPSKTASTLLSVIHQTSMNSTHIIKSIYFGTNQIISFQTIFDAKKEDEFIYSIIMCTTIQNDELNQSIFNLITSMIKFRCGVIEEKTVHEDKENFKRRLQFLHHFLEELNSKTMELWIPYPKFQHFFPSKKVSNLFTDQFGDMPVGCYYDGKFWMGNDDWISISSIDAKMIQMFLDANPIETCRDIPIYLNQGKRSSRLMTIKIDDMIDIYLLAAAKPALHQVIEFMRSNENPIKEWFAKDPIGITDENIIEFLFINHDSQFYVHERKEEVLMEIFGKLRKFQCDSFSMKHKKYVVQYLNLKKKEIYCVSREVLDLRDLIN